MKLKVAELKDNARMVLGKVEDISDVRLSSLSCEGHQIEYLGPLTVTTAIEVSGRQSRANDQVEVVVKYSLDAATPENPRRPAWETRLEMIGTWRQSEPCALPGIALTCFAVAVGTMTLHPYAREVVQSTVSRLGYPGYTMEILNSAAESPENSEIEVAEEC